MEQTKLFDETNIVDEDSSESEIIEALFSDDDYSEMQEKFIVETVQSAFGLSRGGRKRKPCIEAWDWIESDKQNVPFSFYQCCQEYGADPETILNWLRWYQRKLLS